MHRMRAYIAVASALMLLSAGCVERTLTITSEPTGALVYVSAVEAGRTPVKMPFTWYGDYDVVLRLNGYETLKTHYHVKPPIYEIPPLDLLSEMAPWTYHVERSAHFTLTKRTEPADADLIKRADELRTRALESPE
jgi:hypothetical protein